MFTELLFEKQSALIRINRWVKNKQGDEPTIKHDSVAANPVPQLPADLPLLEMVDGREGTKVELRSE
jgi:hypothetical protein